MLYLQSMKACCVLLLWFLGVVGANAQDTLVYFDRSFPKEELTSFPEYWQGVYTNERGVSWEVSAKAISSVSRLYLSYTRDELLNRRGYTIRNGYLFGFVEEDSIPVYESNDTVYFAYSHRKELFALKGKQAVLTQDGQTLYYYQENSQNELFSVVKFTLEKGELKVHYLNAEKVVNSIAEFKPSPSLVQNETVYYEVKNKKKNFEVLQRDEFFDLGMSLTFEDRSK